MDPEGLPLLYQDVKRTLKDTADHILEHLSTVQPRHEDLPLGFNDADGQSATSGVVSINGGATERIVIEGRDGHTLHLSSLTIKPTDPSADAADFPVVVRMAGRTIQRVGEATFRRPPMLDRKDKLVIVITNNSGATANVSYHADGWLRRNVGTL